ncbi:hypothetical protein E4U55_006812 [Claviceps digitariae]|nr:hypothetical protein E4U55_006812 [Claviceps digitariae]
MNRGWNSPLIAMLKKFLERLRHWVRRLWQYGQTKTETQACSAGQNKASNSTSISPQPETLPTERAENLPDDDLAAAVHTSAPETTFESQPQAASVVDQRSSETAPRLHEQPSETSKQPDAQLAVRDAETTEDHYTTTSQQHETPTESSTVDYTTHERTPVVEETVEKQVHTVYQLERTRSNHFHEHFYHIQPIVDTSDDKPVHAADV